MRDSSIRIGEVPNNSLLNKVVIYLIEEFIVTQLYNLLVTQKGETR